MQERVAGTNHAGLVKAESETTGPGRLNMAGAGNHERWGPCMIMFVVEEWGMQQSMTVMTWLRLFHVKEAGG